MVSGWSQRYGLSGRGMRLRPFLRRLRGSAGGWLKSAITTAVVMSAAAGIVHVALAYVRPALVSHGYFELRSIRVVSDGAALAPAEVARRAGLYGGTSIWDVDVKAVEAVLAAPSWVSRASVRRHFPDRVEVTISGRRAVAATVVAGRLYSVDAGGVVYRGEERSRPDLPYLSGWDTPAGHGARVLRLRTALAVALAAERGGLRVSQVDVDADGAVRLFPESPRLQVSFGRRFDADESVGRLLVVIESLDEEALAGVREIDLSYPGRAVVRTRRGRFTTVLSAAGRTAPQRLRGTSGRG